MGGAFFSSRDSIALGISSLLPFCRLRVHLLLNTGWLGCSNLIHQFGDHCPGISHDK
jgi:hypothetical protein